MIFDIVLSALIQLILKIIINSSVGVIICHDVTYVQKTFIDEQITTSHIAEFKTEFKTFSVKGSNIFSDN